MSFFKGIARAGATKGPGHRSVAALAFAVPALSVLPACSIHPVQSEVTGFKTNQIVDRIRCETRLAIQEKAVQKLRAYGKENAFALAAELEAEIGNPWKFTPQRIMQILPKKEEQEFYYRYITTGIAFDFTFDISENNKAGVIADPFRLITNGAAGAILSGSSDNTRGNIRRFTVSDTFEGLLGNPKLPCSADYQTVNYAYPISGKIGIGELIDTFIDLNEDTELKPIEGSPRVFGDTLTFTTILSSAATPHIELTPIGNSWGLNSPTNVGLSASRTDVHKVAVGLSMAVPKTKPQHIVSRVVPLLGAAPAVVGKSNEARARSVAQQQKVDNFLENATVIIRR